MPDNEKHVICPSNEPFGEGNGWDDCSENDATQWQVWTEGPFGECVASFDTRAEAEAFMAAQPAT